MRMQPAQRKAFGLSIAVAVLIGLTLYCAWRLEVASRRGWAGFSYVPPGHSKTAPTTTTASVAGLKPGSIVVVFAGVPAERAGLRRGDSIVSINGISASDFRKMSQ